MKKAIAVFLCIMLTTGMISGCAGREQGADSSGENTAAEENKEDQDAQTEEGQETEEEAAHQTLHDVHGLRIEWDEGEAKVWSAGEMIMRIDYEGQEITDVRYGA